MAVSSRQLKTAGAVAGSLVGLWLLLSIPDAGKEVSMRNPPSICPAANPDHSNSKAAEI